MSDVIIRKSGMSNKTEMGKWYLEVMEEMCLSYESDLRLITVLTIWCELNILLLKMLWISDCDGVRFL